jgi:hypothetical protein
MENRGSDHPFPCSKMTEEIVDLGIGTSCVDCISDEFSNMAQAEIILGLFTQL